MILSVKMKTYNYIKTTSQKGTDLLDYIRHTNLYLNILRTALEDIRKSTSYSNLNFKLMWKCYIFTTYLLWNLTSFTSPQQQVQSHFYWDSRNSRITQAVFIKTAAGSHPTSHSWFDSADSRDIRFNWAVASL